MEWLKKALTNIWFYVAFFLLSLLVPVIINEMYLYGQKTGSGYVTIWGGADALAFFGSFLSFLGPAVLGAVALFQTEAANQKSDDANKLAKQANDQTERANQLAHDALIQTQRANELAHDALVQTQRANELAAQMQKLEQAKFVSMLSVDRVIINRHSIENPNHYNAAMPNPEIIDMVNAGEWPFTDCYHIGIRFVNDSDYPIVQLHAHAGDRNNNNALLYGIKKTESAIYIPPHGEQDFRFIIPTYFFEKYKQTGVSMRLTFVNIFDYSTPATIIIDDLTHSGQSRKYTYRLAKFVDVRPREETVCIVNNDA